MAAESPGGEEGMDENSTGALQASWSSLRRQCVPCRMLTPVNFVPGNPLRTA